MSFLKYPMTSDTIEKRNCFDRETQTDVAIFMNQQCQTALDSQLRQNPLVSADILLQDQDREILFSNHWKSLNENNPTDLRELKKVRKVKMFQNCTFNETSIPKIKNRYYKIKRKGKDITTPKGFRGSHDMMICG